MSIDGWELKYFCEFDKYAEKSYCTIFNEDPKKNLGDITKVDERSLPHVKMMSAGSPCQSFSIAGSQEGSYWKCSECGHQWNPLLISPEKRKYCPVCGSAEHDHTKSAVLVDWLRILSYNKPDWFIYENVKNILGKKFKPTFDSFVMELEGYGYNVHYSVLNAKDFGVPQNRERLFMIGIKKELDNGKFEFPNGFTLEKRFKDVLEEKVDAKYYHSKAALDYMNRKVADGRTHWDFGFAQNDSENEVAHCLTANLYKGVPYNVLITHEPKEKKLYNIFNDDKFNGASFAGNVWDTNEISPALRASTGGWSQPMIEDQVETEVKLRKLTPRECWRLMSFPEEVIDKVIASGMSNTQMYKQAGNAIVKDVPYYIFKELREVMPYLFEDLTVGSFFTGVGAIEMALDKLMN